MPKSSMIANVLAPAGPDGLNNARGTRENYNVICSKSGHSVWPYRPRAMFETNVRVVEARRRADPASNPGKVLRFMQIILDLVTRKNKIHLDEASKISIDETFFPLFSR